MGLGLRPDGDFDGIGVNVFGDAVNGRLAFAVRAGLFAVTTARDGDVASKCAGAFLAERAILLHININHHRAFEVLRGFAADIFSHSIDHSDRIVTFTDNVDDLWNKVNWALNQRTTTG